MQCNEIGKHSPDEDLNQEYGKLTPIKRSGKDEQFGDLVHSQTTKTLLNKDTIKVAIQEVSDEDESRKGGSVLSSPVEGT